jgi:hypothetical protein
VNSAVHADIEALAGLHAAMSRFRQVMREVADRGDDQVEMTRASLAARAGQLQARLEQCQAELDACRARPAEDQQADCSRYVQAVAEAAERLEHVRHWQQRIDIEASEFRGIAGRFRDVLATDLPRTEGHLLAMAASLQAARRVAGPGL